MKMDEDPLQQKALAPTPAELDALQALTNITVAAEAARQSFSPQDGQESASTQFLIALAQLRGLRDQIAAWEPDLIGAARRSGASWAQLAPALGVASRQAAERRYLRLRPAEESGTGDQRVQAERDRRAGQRAVDGWARDNASQLRQLAGQIGALGEGDGLDAVRHALGASDAADLLGPLAAARDGLSTGHPGLAAQITTVGDQVDEIRRASDENRRHPRPAG